MENQTFIDLLRLTLINRRIRIGDTQIFKEGTVSAIDDVTNSSLAQSMHPGVCIRIWFKEDDGGPGQNYLMKIGDDFVLFPE